MSTSSKTDQEVEEKKPNAKSTQIKLEVQGQNGIPVFFKIRRNTPLQKLMGAYCESQSVEQRSYVFLFDGKIVKAGQTPEEVGLEDGDEIDVMLHHDGGACKRSSI